MCNSWLLFLQVVHHLIPRDPQREFSVKYSMSIQKWQGNRPCRQSPLYCNAPSADVVTLAIHVSRIQSILVRTYTTTYNTPRAHSPHTSILNWRSIKTSNQQINWCGSLLWCATTADLFHQTWYGNRCSGPEAESSELDYSFYISTALEWDRQIAHILLTCLAVVMCLKNVSPLSLEFAQLHGIEFAELNKDEFHLTSRHESIRLQDDLQQLFKNKSCNCFNL